jgi:hypothetical protein
VKEQCRKLKVIKDAGGRMARAKRIFESPIVLEVCQITTVIYILEK